MHADQSIRKAFLMLPAGIKQHTALYEHPLVFRIPPLLRRAVEAGVAPDLSIGLIVFIGWIGFIGFVVANIDLLRRAIRAESHPAKAWIVVINERAPPPDTAVVPVAMAITVDDNAPPLMVPVAVAMVGSAFSIALVAVSTVVSAFSIALVAVSTVVSAFSIALVAVSTVVSAFSIALAPTIAVSSAFTFALAPAIAVSSAFTFALAPAFAFATFAFTTTFLDQNEVMVIPNADQTGEARLQLNAGSKNSRNRWG
jgi:hypothetical protein